MFPLHWNQKQGTRCLFCKTRCGCDWTKQYGQEAGRERKPTKVIVTYVRMWRSDMKRAKPGVELPCRSAGDAVGCEGSAWAVGKVKGVRSTSRKSIRLGNPPRLQPTFPGGFARGRNQALRCLKWHQVPEQPLGAAQGRLTDTRGLCHPLITVTLDALTQNHPGAAQPPRQKPQHEVPVIRRGACDQKRCHVWHVSWHSKPRARGTDTAVRSPPFLESLQRWQTQARPSRSGVTALKQW